MKRKQNLNAAGLIAPALIVLAVVIGYPILRAVWLSFQGNRHLNPKTGIFEEGGFAGLENYLYWINNRCVSGTGQISQCPPGVIATDFWPALKITLFFTVVTVLLETILGMFMAIIMNGEYKGRGLVRAAVLVPWAIPTAVTAKLWQFMFAPDGIVNSLLGTHISWTTDPFYARLAVIIADVWKTAPFMALLILAGLQMIPRDVYDAARVDGASRILGDIASVVIAWPLRASNGARRCRSCALSRAAPSRPGSVASSPGLRRPDTAGSRRTRTSR